MWHAGNVVSHYPQAAAIHIVFIMQTIFKERQDLAGHKNEL